MAVRLGQDRLELGGQAVLAEAAQAEGAHDALRVDEEGGGQAGHEVVAVGLVPGVLQDRPGGAHVRGEVAGPVGEVLVHHAQDLQAVVRVVRIGVHHERELLAAGRAPGRPEVDEHGPAAQLGERDGVAIDGQQVDVWGCLADQRMATHGHRVRRGPWLSRRWRAAQRDEEHEEQRQERDRPDEDEPDGGRTCPRFRHCPAAARAATGSA